MSFAHVDWSRQASLYEVNLRQFTAAKFDGRARQALCQFFGSSKHSVSVQTGSSKHPATDGKAARMGEAAKLQFQTVFEASAVGHRLLEKEAVLLGGGKNHRLGLYDGILIKDNHIRVAGGIAEALSALNGHANGLPVEIEADTIDQVRDAVDAGAPRILLDNMSPEQVREAVVVAFPDRRAGTGLYAFVAAVIGTVAVRRSAAPGGTRRSRRQPVVALVAGSVALESAAASDVRSRMLLPLNSLPL